MAPYAGKTSNLHSSLVRSLAFHTGMSLFVMFFLIGILGKTTATVSSSCRPLSASPGREVPGIFNRQIRRRSGSF